jgi:uncharacterized protein (DUF1800 family)
LAAGLLVFLAAAPAPVFGQNFRRGDSNADGKVDLSDAIHILLYQFVGGATPPCLKAIDANDTGKIDISDGVFILGYLFMAGSEPPAPGPTTCGPDPTPDSISCASFPPCGADPELLRRAGHLLNRAGYGPNAAELDRILAVGTTAWIDEQLQPLTVDEASNTALNTRVTALTETVVRSLDDPIVSSGAVWSFQKGTVAPPANWRMPDFDDSLWPTGPAGFGYGDLDDVTVLEDMFGNYTTVYIRHEFTMTASDIAAIDRLVLSINYDDGFVAYLNGFEVARRNAIGSPPAYNAVASGPREAGSFEDIDITTQKARLVAGPNVLAFQGLNQLITSTDLSLDPALLNRTVLPGGTSREIKGISELKGLAFVEAVYSRRQLQAVLADFWSNHLTTDYDKVADYLNTLTNSDATKAMTTAQAQKEAARLSYREYQFFRDHALGNFGDLLHFSATSPSMLIYLDNVLNVRGNANENYAREIMELHTMGADNGYVQIDIEQLAKCFTGWGACKVAPGNETNPNAPCGVQVSDTPIVAAGTAGGNWRYFKGNVEPPANWMDQDFLDGGWLVGQSGFGYGDNDDRTILLDMQNSYTTLYLRKTFTLTTQQISDIQNLILSVDVDDGFIAYLNGTEVARYYAPGDPGSIVPFTGVATLLHEAGAPFEYNLNRRKSMLVAGNNVLAIQVLNSSKESTDLTMIPVLLDREILPGSIENGDPNGVWAFHFFPNLHNSAEAKTLFRSTPYQLNVPAGRTGTNGIQDADDAITRILNHPSTASFVCSKLIQRFVNDAIDFRNPAQGDYAGLLARCISAWNSTTPKGDIAKVMRVILTSPEFWSEGAYRAKVKSGFEAIASTVRVLDGMTDGVSVVDDLQAMGMQIFDRDDPDGNPEAGTELMDTNGILNRIKLAQAMSEGTTAALGWTASTYLTAHGINTADKFVDFFDDLLFQGTLTAVDRAMVKEFLTTDITYQNTVPFSAIQAQQALGLMLSLPQWQFQ